MLKPKICARKRFRTRKLEEHGLKGDSKAAIAIKNKFKLLDFSGNGMLEVEELSQLLPGLTKEELHALFFAVDADRSGSVSFDEFVDFVFGSALAAVKKGWQSQESFSEYKDLHDLPDLPKTPMAERSDKIYFDGAMLFKAVNGVMDGSGSYNGHPSYEWSRSRCISNLEPLERSDGSPSPNRQTGGSVLARASAGLFLFYGWTIEPELVGWFIAESKPPEGDPVKTYLLFNPCPTADRPDLCRAMWQTVEGDRDKRLICDETPLRKSEIAMRVHVSERNLIDEELWGEISENEEEVFKYVSWEDEWAEQQDETMCDDSDWDSDAYLASNTHKAKIGEDARAAKEARRLAKQAKEAWAESSEETKKRESREEVEELILEEGGQQDGSEDEAEEIVNERAAGKGLSPRAQRRKGRKPKKKDIPGMTVRMHAPGFKVRTAVKTAPTDHLARTSSPSRKGRKLSVSRMVARRGSLASVESMPNNEDDMEEGEGEDEEDPNVYEDGGFVDPEFPPGNKSLGADMPEVDGWKRLPQLNPQAVLFYRVVPDDVFIQAFAGNVWFLSACAAVAEYPAWIRSMFGHRENLSSAGRYKVRLFHPGKKKFIRFLIDDYVPIRRGTKSPAFAGITSDAEIWVALVEKAFAKMCGSYAQTEWGSHAFGLHYLCGGRNGGSWIRNGPSRWRRSRTVWLGDDSARINRQVCEGKEEVGDWRDEDEVWSLLRLAMERCYSLACGVDKEKASTSQTFGLLSGRVYSVVGAREVPTSDGWFLRMVLIRNPYGAGTWTGRWSDRSETWAQNENVADYLDFRGPHKDGTFWMSFSDFVEYFESIEFVRKAMPIQGANKAKIVGMKRGMRKYRERLETSKSDAP